MKLASKDDEDEWHERVLDFINRLKNSGKIQDYNQLAFLFSSVKHERVISLARFLESNHINVYSPRSDMFFRREEVMQTLGCMMLMFPNYVKGLENGEYKFLDNTHYFYFRDCIKAANEFVTKPENLELKRFIRAHGKEHATYVASVGDQQDSIEMRYEDENIWLTQKMMATLYDVDVRTINEHIKKIYSDSELEEDSTIRNFRIVQTEGSRQVTRDTKHYNLQMIIAVGFKVNSERAVQFRKWVNQIAKDYTIKGWVMDDERLKRGTYLTEKYFDEQLERIREIRASERKFYQKITDLYATAIDYDKNSAMTRRFYATVQNKMHYAVHGHTAAELIVRRADHTKEHMGLTTWADAPEGKIKKSDVTVAKNYLSQDEMKQLNRMVTAYLDFAENMTLRHIPLTMQDWEKRLNSFIEMFDYGILQDAGKVSAEIAKLHAETEFEKYRVIQDRLFMSDFDKYMLELEENTKK